MPSCEVCAFLFVPPEGVFLFMLRGYLNSGIPLLEKTQMELLYNCTLVYDIDAIVLHTNSNTMGQNHVLHIVISVSPFFVKRRCLYVSFFLQLAGLLVFAKLNWFVIGLVPAPSYVYPFPIKYVKLYFCLCVSVDKYEYQDATCI